MMKSGKGVSLEESMFSFDEKIGVKFRKEVGGHNKLARIFHVSPQTLDYWFNKIKQMPFSKMMMVNMLTGGKIQWFELSPQILEYRSKLNEATGLPTSLDKTNEELLKTKNHVDSALQHLNPFIKNKKK